MSTLHFDKEKYLQIMRSSGVNEAITLLHLDIKNWEVEAFEGEEGYQADMIQDLMDVRTFSRELWEVALQNLGTPLQQS